MLSPTITHRTHESQRYEQIDVQGPVTTADHADAITSLATLVARDKPLVVNLTAVSALNDTGLQGLRSLVRDCHVRGQQVIFVCADMLLRSELVLADLDTLAPVVEADEHAAAIAA